MGELANVDGLADDSLALRDRIKDLEEQLKEAKENAFEVDEPSPTRQKAPTFKKPEPREGASFASRGPRPQAEIKTEQTVVQETVIDRCKKCGETLSCGKC